MDQHLQRARFHFDQERYPEALAELQNAEAASPDNPFVHGWRARCLARLDRLQQAEEAANRCIEVAPDLDYGHAIKAEVLADRRQYQAAREAALTAVHLDPENSSNHGQLARIEFHLGNWEPALTAANAGLQVDASDDVCRHWRAHSLRKLGRKGEADQDIQTLLAENPEDPYTHDAKGWFLLDEGRHDEARRHFLEALRLMPDFASARDGFATALKSRHLVFSWALRTLIWLNRFRSWVMYAGAIALLLTLRFGDRWMLSHPEHYVVVTLLKFGIWTAVVLLAVAHSLFDIVLRFDPEGRRVLTPEQIRMSNWNMLCFLLALAIMGLWAWQGGRMLPILALSTVMLTSAVSNTFQASCTWVRVRMKWLTILAAVIIPLAWLMPLLMLILALKFKLIFPWLIKSMFYLPVVSLAITGFSDELLEYFEKKKPDTRGAVSGPREMP